MCVFYTKLELKVHSIFPIVLFFDSGHSLIRLFVKSSVLLIVPPYLRLFLTNAFDLVTLTRVF